MCEECRARLSEWERYIAAMKAAMREAGRTSAPIAASGRAAPVGEKLVPSPVASSGTQSLRRATCPAGDGSAERNGSLAIQFTKRATIARFASSPSAPLEAASIKPRSKAETNCRNCVRDVVPEGRNGRLSLKPVGAPSRNMWT